MDAGVLQTHTATQQWQSFEIRMRRRRIDRCILRAAVAIDAGSLEDAREALEEVERLDPHEPAIEPLRAKLAAAKSRAVASTETPAVEPSLPENLVVTPAVPVAPLSEKPFTPLPEKPVRALPEKLVTALPDQTVPETLTPELGFLAVPETSRRVLPASAAAVQIVISGTAGWFVFSYHSPSEGKPLRADTAVVYDSNTPAPRTTPRAELAVAEPAVRLSETAVTAAATSESIAEPVAPGATAGAAEPALSSSPDNAAVDAARTTAAMPPPEPSSSNTTKTSAASPITPPPAPAIERRAIPASLEPSPALPDAAPAPPVAPASGAVPAVSGNDAAASSPLAPVALAPPSETAAAAATTVPAAPSPTTSQPAEENRVRGVLSRYEAAYSALDAAAASAVWPGVDRRALTSAFQALSSQNVSLGRCDVRVTGEAAQADCRGTAKWEPKIGGGAQTAARQWRFDLRNTGGDWIITRATVR